MTWIIFDSNAYRDLVDDAQRQGASVADVVARLRAEEAGAGAAALGNLYVAQELLANLGTPVASPKTTRSSRDGIEALIRHTSNAEGRPRFMASVEAQLCQSLYGRVPAALAETGEGVVRLAQILAADPAAHTHPSIAQALADNAAAVAATERAFVDDMVTAVLRQHPAGPVTWDAVQRDAVARDAAARYLASPSARAAFPSGLALRAAHLVGAPLGDPAITGQLLAHAARIDEQYPAGRTLYVEILRRMLLAGANLTKKARENWVWDLMIACSVGPGRVQTDALTLVTSDRAIVDACDAAGFSAFVREYPTYRANLAHGRV